MKHHLMLHTNQYFIVRKKVSIQNIKPYLAVGDPAVS